MAVSHAYVFLKCDVPLGSRGDLLTDYCMRSWGGGMTWQNRRISANLAYGAPEGVALPLMAIARKNCLNSALGSWILFAGKLRTDRARPLWRFQPETERFVRPQCRSVDQFLLRSSS